MHIITCVRNCFWYNDDANFLKSLHVRLILNQSNVKLIII